MRERVADCFGLSPAKDSLSFKEFLVGLSSFNVPGSADQKLKLAFKLQDFDNDGRLSKDDLIKYLQTISAVSEGTEVDYAQVADEILKETSTDEEHRYLTFENFQRVVAPTDFESRLRIVI
jgi:Ca2+-binding EF-hand superfamily protein